MEHFSDATRSWFAATFGEPTAVQRRGWDAIASGRHTLLAAPTGSGKTLAAFLFCIDRLGRHAPAVSEGSSVSVLYVSPLKALVYDVERNLRAPLAGIQAASQLVGPWHAPRVSVRTGDTSAAERRQQARSPGEILVTTPESLYLLLGSRARERLRSVQTVIVDEVHALAGQKRGSHLALSLERLTALCGRDPQRIGLSATARPLSEVARFLGGDREVQVVDTSEPPHIDLQIKMPAGADDSTPKVTKTERGLWPLIAPELLAEIRAHRSTIVFVNSRGLCERLAHRLNDLAGEELVHAHHGSLAHAERSAVEERLKRGEIAGIVATSSLELGIDMGAVDLVLLVESPGSVARGLQRIGRAGHGVGQVSKGRLYPKHRGDLLESAVVARRMREGAIEALALPENPLDVLAQQIVALVATQDIALQALEALVKRSASFARLPRSALVSVLDMLSGHDPSHAFSMLRPRVVWDRDSNLLKTRRGAAMVALVNGGTIPDRGSYAVYLGEHGPRLGELDEEMVHESTAGEVFALGASSFRIEQITRDRVIVSAAPGESGKLPFWRGDGPGRPIELGRALGAFVRELSDKDEPAALQWLQDGYHLDAQAARGLWDYVREQQTATGSVPSDRAITIERFRDELGDHRICILSPFGARVHAPWALAIQAALAADHGIEPQVVYGDDGIVLRLPEAQELELPLHRLVPDPDEVEDVIVAQLASTPLFAGLFRENAARALLLPRRRPGNRTPLWLQRRRAAELLAAAREHPSFPIVLETYRSCLQDVFDLSALRELLAAVARREVVVHAVETAAASPFARGLVFAYVASNLYQGDAPLAEGRAQALTLDRELLRELLGEAALRDLLDPELIAEIEAELQGLHPSRRARDPDGVHDLLRRVGDLSPSELTARCEGDAEPWLAELEQAKRATRLALAGEARVVAVEDVALYRDALSVTPPPGLPPALLEPVTAGLAILCERHARAHGPFRAAELAHRYGLSEHVVEQALQPLANRGVLVRGALRPGGTGEEYCDAEVLRRIKRRTVARLRADAQALPAATLARFLPAWHAIDVAGQGPARLRQAIVQLEGLALPVSELESAILPARVRDFSPAMLDELGSTGFLCFVGRGALGGHDGKVALYRRSHVASLLEPAQVPEQLGAVARALLSELERRGARFFAELAAACAPATTEQVLDGLYELLWAGLVTNDTFAPLRSLARPRSKSARVQARAVARAAAGRWSACSDLVREPPTPTLRAHARCVSLLERHGLLTPEAAALEDLPGGFAALYPVLKAMEEAGKIRRGYFVEGLGGAQFAYAGAVERLRAVAVGSQRGALLLSAVDPANPFGWLLPWPDAPEPGDGHANGASRGQRARRVAGACVVIVDREPVLYLSAGGKHLTTFPAANDPKKLEVAIPKLRELARRSRAKRLRVEQIDGEQPRASALTPRLLELAFIQGYRGLELDAR